MLLNTDGEVALRTWMYRRENSTVVQSNPYALVHFHSEVRSALYQVDAESVVRASLMYQFRLERHFEVT